MLQPPDPMGFLAVQFAQLKPPVDTVINAMPLRCFLDDLKKEHLEVESTLDLIRKLAPPTVDLGDPMHDGLAQDLADLLLRFFPVSPAPYSSSSAAAPPPSTPTASLEAFLEQSRKRKGEPALLQLAAFLAISKRMVQSVHNPSKFSVVIPLFTQHIRIQTKEEHAEGEDFLRRKIKQLEWLCLGSKATWNLIVVDDGCKLGSADAAKKILSDASVKEKCTVLSLAEGVTQDSSNVKGLNPDDSKLGMSVHYGLSTAARRPFRGHHILTYCSPHFSIHLGQCGLLVDAIVNNKQNVHIASPYNQNSIYIATPPTALLKNELERKTDGANEALSVFLARTMLPLTNGFPGFGTGVGQDVAAQLVRGSFGCVQGLVGFSSTAAIELTQATQMYDEAFDIELVMRALLAKEPQVTYGALFVAKTDSEYSTMKLSNIKGLVDQGNIEQPFARTLRLLQALARIKIPEDLADFQAVSSCRSFVSRLTVPEWAQLAAQPPDLPAVPSVPSDEVPFDSALVQSTLAKLSTATHK